MPEILKKSRDVNALREVLPPGMTEESALAVLQTDLRFTKRETEIALELLIAADDETIAAWLGGSALSVKVHRREIRAKLKVRNCRIAAAKITAALWRYAR